MTILKKFINIFDKTPWSKLGPHITIAISGGADSLALTLLLHDYLQDKNIKLTALTVNHSLRKSSLSEARNLNRQLIKLGISHHILEWNPIEIQTGIQKKARDARYRLMQDWCLKNNVNSIFLAHHKEDQVETFWLRMIKHSGIDGLSCMSFLRQDNQSGIFFIRPLLKFSKQQLKDVCNYYEQTWFEDPSNQQDAFTRNIIRKNIRYFPFGQKDVLRLINCFSIIRQNLQKHTADIMQNCIKLYDEGYVTLDIKIWEQQPKEIQLRILQNILMTISGNNYPPRSEKLKTARTKILNKNDFTSFGCMIAFEQDKIIFCKEASTLYTQKIIENCFVWNKCFKVTSSKLDKTAKISPLKTRGLSFLSKNEKKLYISKYKKLPKYVRQSLPVLEENNEIIAIPHLGYKKENISINFFPKTPISGIYMEIV